MQLPSHSYKSGALPRSGFSAFKLIDSQLDQVKKLIDEELSGCFDKIGNSGFLGTFNICGGKMIRPGLVLLSARAIGKTTSEHIRIAAIIEMIHNATLLHDDIMDEGQKRRSVSSVNSLLGNESAVLLGDFLISRAFKMCVNLEPQVIRIIAAMTLRICEGQLRQVTEMENWDLSELEYIDIITEKSAAFFISCCYLGGLLAEASETQVRALADFGLNTGVAFQITDDLLDIVGDESEMGKIPGGDVNENRLTLAIIRLLRTVDEREKRAVINSYLKRDVRYRARDRRYAEKALIEKLRSCGSLEYACARAQEYVSKAIASLKSLKESSAKDALIETAKFGGRQVI